MMSCRPETYMIHDETMPVMVIGRPRMLWMSAQRRRNMVHFEHRLHGCRHSLVGAMPLPGHRHRAPRRGGRQHMPRAVATPQNVHGPPGPRPRRSATAGQQCSMHHGQWLPTERDDPGAHPAGSTGYHPVNRPDQPANIPCGVRQAPQVDTIVGRRDDRDVLHGGRRAGVIHATCLLVHDDGMHSMVIGGPLM